MANEKQVEEMKKFGMVGALIGAVIGGFLAIIFSDEKNRKKFKKGFDQFKNEAIDMIDETSKETKIKEVSSKKLTKANKKSK